MKVKLIITFIFCCISLISFSQNAVGTWQGQLSINGNPLPIIFHIKKDSTDKLVAVFDSPNQKAFGLPCSGINMREDSLIISIQMIAGYYAGKFYNNDSLLGIWHQGKGSLPLNLKKINSASTFTERKHPQTPKPPFNYFSTDVEYDNSNNSIHYSGTFTKPFADKKYPAVILITGSGRQDRDENIFDHKPFAVIADYLTKRGIAVLRVDDRGMGNTTGNYETSTSADFAKDVEAGIRYLKSREDVDVKKIGLIGHSEGGMIAPMVAAKNKDVAFIVMLAGVGVGGKATNDYQNILPLRNACISEQNIKRFLLLHHALVNATITINDIGRYENAVKKIYFDWKKSQPSATLQALIKGSDDVIIKSLQKNYSALKNPWWYFFLTYQPSADIQKLTIPVLALNGEKDIQVEPKQNLAAIKAALKKSKSKNYKILELPGLNHLFQHCNTCTIQEYAKLEETFAPEVLKIMGDWIVGVVK